MRLPFASILLTVAVTLAVGVCPCGRALLARRLAGALLPVASLNGSAVRGHCPACNGDDQGSPRPDPNNPDPRLCAATVSGELPSLPVDAPAVDISPAVFQPVAVLSHLELALADHDSFLRPGLRPPPTLLNLSCCLNT